MLIGASATQHSNLTRQCEAFILRLGTKLLCTEYIATEYPLVLRVGSKPDRPLHGCLIKELAIRGLRASYDVTRMSKYLLRAAGAEGMGKSFKDDAFNELDSYIVQP